MEWNVKNALNRNVEREQLNKILKEIEAAIKGTSESVTKADVQRWVEEAVGSTASPTLRSFTITITGDASGSGTSRNLSDVVIPVEIENQGVEEAPFDTNFYWRTQGSWAPVPFILSELAYLDADGLVAYDPDEGWLSGEAPEDDKFYARRNGEWVEVESTGGGRILPVVTGEIINDQPQFVYLDDGSLVYTEI